MIHRSKTVETLEITRMKCNKPSSTRPGFELGSPRTRPTYAACERLIGLRRNYGKKSGLGRANQIAAVAANAAATSAAAHGLLTSTMSFWEPVRLRKQQNM